jgi:hypothetical protein
MMKNNFKKNQILKDIIEKKYYNSYFKKKQLRKKGLSQPNLIIQTRDLVMKFE